MKLHIQNLSFARNDQFILNKINCELNRGELLQVCGENGCGKTTLLRMLLALIEPVDGDILWNNKSIFDYREDYQQHINYLGHRNGVKPQLTVKENLNLFATLSQNPESDIAKILDEINLTAAANKEVRYLSAGQTRRVGFARFLLNPDSSIWILDEPTTGLDADFQNILFHHLTKHLTRGGIAIVATHLILPSVGKIKTLTLGKHHA